MKELVERISSLCDLVKSDIAKEGNKAAMARVRKYTLELEKAGRLYRKESIKASK